MSKLRWYRSLYWRIALGLIAFLAIMLAAEGGIFLWMTDRIAGSMPARSPRRLAALVASDLGTALANNAQLDIETYIQEEFGRTLQTFVVIMRDGQILANHDDVPPQLLDAVREELESMEARGPRRFGRRGAWGEGLGVGGRQSGPPPGTPAGPPPDRAPRPGRPRRGEFALVMVGGQPIGRVVVLPGGPPFSRIVRQFGPTIALVATSVLVVGTTLIALVVFGPARRRLKAVQAATERLGGGDLDARAPEHGGDEVTALARSFNRMASELSHRTRALETADTTRRKLFADVSHELMTPLTAMRGYLETLSMPELVLDALTRERYLQIVSEETHRLERIVGDLLDLARLEGGGTALRRERVEVAALFDRVAARHERELRQRNVQLDFHVDRDAELVTGDPDRLEQALQNLAANALRHTPDGGRITLTSVSDPAGVRLTVRDTGPGIPEQHLPLIFERFYKADAARKAAGGSGLGLSIVKAIVERHGGTITARNEAGAVFEIVLPTGLPSSTPDNMHAHIERNRP
jgi:two-component system OmpR family sensor kinase